MNPENLNFKNDFEKAMFYKHLKPYEYLRDKLAKQTVLEIGCGAGYGSYMLGEVAERIVTIDRDKESLDNARKNFGRENIEYLHADFFDNLPLEENSFDTVISFQVFEHISPKDTRLFLDKISRLLKPGGIFYMTTPNREIRLLPFQRPTNHYHKKEYSHVTLHKSVSRVFPDCFILGLHSDSEIEQMFYTRKNQRYWLIYIVKPFRKVIYKTSKLLGIGSMVQLLERRSHYTPPSVKISGKTIDTDIFDFQERDLDTAIDFLVVCQKH